MNPNALDTTNVWLAVIALVSVVEVLALAAGGFLAFRLYRRVTTVLEEIERKHVAPLSQRVSAVVDDARAVVARVQGIEHQVADAIHRVDESAVRTVATVKARMWPLVGLARGVRAAIAAATAGTGPSGRTGATGGYALGK
jgi:hypothetical protein